MKCAPFLCAGNTDTVAIRKGKPLEGRVLLFGAKNSIGKIVAATMLSDDESVISNVPLIGETFEAFRLAELMFGARITRIAERTFSVQGGRRSGRFNEPFYLKVTSPTRIPLLLIPVQLKMFNKAFVPRRISGDPIGPRPYDFHLAGYGTLGASIFECDEGFYIVAPGGLRGAIIHLPFPSVSATASLALAGCVAQGITTIVNAAVDPEIIELVEHLRGMEVNTHFDVSNRVLSIEGTAKLRGRSHKLIQDRQVAASFAIAALASAGDIWVEGIGKSEFGPVLDVLIRNGANVELSQNAIRFSRVGQVRSAKVESGPFPAFPSDCLPQLGLMLTQACGTSILHETVFESRFEQLLQITSAGAEIKIDESCPSDSACRFSRKHARHRCRITGPTPLSGGRLRIKDLRTGFACLLAGSLSDRWSVVTGVKILERGYEDLLKVFERLGAEIRRP